VITGKHLLGSENAIVTTTHQPNDKEEHEVTIKSDALQSNTKQNCQSNSNNRNNATTTTDLDEKLLTASMTSNSSVSFDSDIAGGVKMAENANEGPADATHTNANNSKITVNCDDLEETAETHIHSTCSPTSPYQAFLFSSDWYGSGELKLPNTGSSSSRKKNDNDGNESVASGAYFEPVDLDSSNWRKAIAMGPTFGFALAALASFLVSPTLFMAGAFAYGTFHAAGMGYNYCNGGGGGGSGDGSAENASAQPGSPSNLSTTEIAASWEQALLSICYRELPVEEAEKVIAESKEAARTQALPEEETDKSNLMMSPPSSEDPAKANTTASAKEKSDMPLSQCLVTEAPTTKAHPLSNEEVESIYSPLCNSVVKDVSFPGLHAIEFFRVFFADDAPYNFKELQKQRGDLDIQYDQWRPLGPKEPVMLHHDPKLHTAAANSAKSSYQARVLTFKAKTDNFVGPLYANTKKTQRTLHNHKTLVVIESRTDVSDIPFSNRFYVLERWVIRATKVRDGSKHKYVATLSASSQVVFTQSCSFAGQIKSKSAAFIKDLVKCWCTMAQDALVLAEERKNMRLQHEHDLDSDFENTENEDELEDQVVDVTTVKDNLPPSSAHEEGIEMTWPGTEADGSISNLGVSSHAGRRPQLNHTGSLPLGSYRGKAMKGFRRSVSGLLRNHGEKR